MTVQNKKTIWTYHGQYGIDRVRADEDMVIRVIRSGFNRVQRGLLIPFIGLAMLSCASLVGAQTTLTVLRLKVEHFQRLYISTA
jgi:hypothetical protein